MTRAISWLITIIKDVPSTNLKAVGVLVLAYIFTIGVLACWWNGKQVSEGALLAMGAFIAGLEYGAVRQFTVKRETDRETLEAKARATQAIRAVEAP